MPITLPVQTKRISQSEFGDIAYEVMKHVFAIHDEFGRFLDEKFYKRELATRVNDIALETPISVTFRDFSKLYYLDVLKSNGGLLEFKAVEAIHPRHRAQVVNYLLLADLAHAKIVNVRTESVEHEFVNCTRRLADLRNPTFVSDHWEATIPGADSFQQILRLLIEDWGTGLDLALYNAALCHFLAGEMDVEIMGSSRELGTQPMRMAACDVAFRITALQDRHDTFAVHSQRLLKRTTLRAILWANIAFDEVQFRMICR